MNDALDPGKSVWVSANAGSGKTYTLANRVARLLLNEVKPERILCLTYTKAAAAEMQSRLFDQLGRWAMEDNKTLAGDIDKIGGAITDLAKARRLFAEALETPGGLKINTIHSFCQYLLARFPLEAGVAPGFRVLDDQTARELRNEARARVLERAGNGDETLAGAVAYLVTHTSENRLQLVLDAALGGDRRKLDRFLASVPDSEAMRRVVFGAHGASLEDTYDKLASSFCDDLHNEEETLLDVIAWLSKSNSKSDKERAELLRIAFEERSYDDFRKFFMTGKGEAQKKLVTVGLQKQSPHLNEYLLALAQRFYDAEEKCRAAHAAALAHASLVLAKVARGEYSRAKDARAGLDYDDLIARTLHLLRNRETSAWVLYKLDGGIDHVLIDEAQDTSPEQWEIVRALTAEFFAGEGRPVRGPRTVFAVGDEKQSIFSFQGADPSQFEKNRDYFAEQATEGALAFKSVPLTTSWRSAPEILQFVDRVFADDAARNGLAAEDIAIHHDPHRTKARGRVEFWPALMPEKKPDLEYWRPVDVLPETSPVVELAKLIADQIKTWTDGKTRLPGHDKPITPGDIMVLMPRREPFASEIIRQLKHRGVAVAGADRIRLNEQIAVMDLAALGRFALLPEDDLNLASLLRSPLIDVSEDDLFTLAHGRKGALWKSLEKHAKQTPFVWAHSFLSECRSRADQMPPYEFFARALSADGLRKRVLARLGPEANDAVDEFLSLALSYEAMNPPSLEGFLHWLQRGDAEIKRDMDRGRDEVRVMTVHGAKGLEADIVILPDTTTLPEDTGQHGNLIYTDDGPLFPIRNISAPQAVIAAKQAAKAEALREHRRLLYVALTRARDRLCICGFANQKGIKEGSWYRFAEKAAKELGIALERNEGIIHVFGDADVEPTSEKSSAKHDVVLKPWMTAKPGPENMRPRLIRPFDAAGMEEPATFSPATTRFQRGILIHDLLARLPDVPTAKRHDIALTFLRARGVDDDNAVKLADETLAVLNDPQFAAAFAPGSRAEVAIIAEIDEGKLVTGRIDRIAITDGEILIVDFKTNRPPAERVEDVSALYRTQMALYRAALAKIFPGRRIGCALVWTEGPRLMPLPDALMEAEISHIRNRLDSKAPHS